MIQNMHSYTKINDLHAIKLSRAFGYLFEGEVWALYALALSLPEHAVVVNIGAGSGTSSLAILEARQDLCQTFYTVDISRGGPLGGMENERNAFNNCGLKYGHQVLGDSKEIGRTWESGRAGLCDMVFVDGDHSREGVRGDIAVWRPLVKPGGIMAFHDYTSTNWAEVASAVDELMADCCLILKVDTFIAFRMPL